MAAFDMTYVRYYGVTVEAPDEDAAIKIAQKIPTDGLESNGLELLGVEELTEEAIKDGLGWAASVTGNK